MSLHHDSFVADLHCDTVWPVSQGADFAGGNTHTHIDLPRLIAGEVNLQIFACFLHHDIPADQRVATVDRLLDRLDAMFAAGSDRIAQARSATEADKIVAGGQIAAVTGIENGEAIDNSLDTLRHFFERGVRIMTLSHNASHDWCLSSSDQNHPFDGLTDFGRKVVRTMNELGMIVDISHIAPSAVDAVLKVTSKPIVASHSNAHALCPHDRNLTDAQIRAIADNGGMIGINFCGDFLLMKWHEIAVSHVMAHLESLHEVDKFHRLFHADGELAATLKRLEPFLSAWERAVRTTGVDTSTVADHIDYIVRLVGDDFVGLGTDYDGIFFPPAGLEECSRLPNLTEEMAARGYSEGRIRKILGENFRRVFGEVCPD